jgi:hypothetical protein
MLAEIETKIRKAEEALKKIHYSQERISAREFHEYMTGARALPFCPSSLRHFFASAPFIFCPAL